PPPAAGPRAPSAPPPRPPPATPRTPASRTAPAAPAPARPPPPPPPADPAPTPSRCPCQNTTTAAAPCGDLGSEAGWECAGERVL
ncbi:Os07g0559550, partial [Oryza sativa Japonica Group]